MTKISPRISVVIVSELRKLDYLDKCLESLAKQTTKYKFEVLIVAYGNVTLDLQPWIQKGLDIRIVHVNKNNYCLKRNVGAKKARGEIVAYIDDDTIVEPHWVNAILDGFEREWKMAGGCVKPIFEGKIPNNLRGYERLIKGFNYLTEIGYSSKLIIGCNMFYNRRWLLEIGGFDEYIGELNNIVPKKYYGGDETDIQERLSNSQIGFIPKAILSHAIQENRLSIQYILNRALGMGRMRSYIDNKQDKKRYNLYHKYFYRMMSLFYFDRNIKYRRLYNYISGYFDSIK